MKSSLRAPLRSSSIAIACLGVANALAAPPGRQAPEEEPQWGFYGGDAGGSRHSMLTQIDRRNVARLEIAWTYRTGELGAGFASADKLAFEATPILARRLLYLSTPTNIVIALDPASGKERWRYNPKIARKVRLCRSDLARSVVMDRSSCRSHESVRAANPAGHARRPPHCA